MNEKRRKALNARIGQLEEIKSAIEDLQNEEQEFYDNMPESIQSGEKGEAASQVVENLNDVVGNLDDAIMNLGQAVGET